MYQAVTLHFPSLEKLYGFNNETSPNNFEISTRALLLSCDCKDDHIQLAVTKYGATIVKQENGNKNVSDRPEKNNG
jgi:hypothetical protein